MAQMDDEEIDIEKAIEESPKYRKIQTELSWERSRHETLNDQVQRLHEQLQVLNDKNADSRTITECLRAQNKYLKQKLNNEKFMKHQAVMKFISRMAEIRGDNTLRCNRMKELTDSLSEKYASVQEVVAKFEEKRKEAKEDSTQEPDVVRIAMGLAEDKGDDDVDEEEEGDDNEKPEEPQEKADDDEAEDPSTNEAKQMKQVLIEISKFKALRAAAGMESEHLRKLFDTLSERIDEIDGYLEQSKATYFESKRQLLLMQNKLQKLKATARDKSSKKIWDKGSAKSRDIEVQEKTETDHLSVIASLIEEENEMMRKFLESSLQAKEDEYRLYETLTSDLEKLLNDNVENTKKTLGIAVDDKDEEQEDVGDEEEEDDKDDEDA